MANKYTYRGNEYTLAALAALAGKSKSTLLYRLASGMTIEEAVDRPNQNSVRKRPVEEGRPQFRIVFQCWVPGVFDRMQPRLNKVYVATQFIPEGGCGETNREYYTIPLENGKNLIVYPNEFINLGAITDVA